MLKRWPSLISDCVLTLTENLRDSKAPEHVVLGSCSILASPTVLRHLTTVRIFHNHILYFSYISDVNNINIIVQCRILFPSLHLSWEFWEGNWQIL